MVLGTVTEIGYAGVVSGAAHLGGPGSCDGCGDERAYPVQHLEHRENGGELAALVQWEMGHAVEGWALTDFRQHQRHRQCSQHQQRHRDRHRHRQKEMEMLSVDGVGEWVESHPVLWQLVAEQ